MSNAKCPICDSQAEVLPTNRDGKNVNCTKCGKYFVTGTVLAQFQYEDIKKHLPKLSSWISEQNKILGIERPEISTSNADKIIEQKDKSIKEKFDCFMKNIANYLDTEIDVKFFNHCYITDEQELELFFQRAIDKNYIVGKVNQFISGGSLLMYSKLRYEGLEYIESLSEINKNSKNIFVAFHFTKELQQIFDNDIKSAIEELGFNYVRVSSSITDTDTHINDDIIGKIKSSKIVIADFGGQRNSVYFEAGFAMGLKIPVIWSCRENEVDILSFDTRQYPHVLWNTKEEFVEKIIQRIKTLV